MMNKQLRVSNYFIRAGMGIEQKRKEQEETWTREGRLKLEKYLPPRIITECFENHVRVKMVPQLPDNHTGEYDIETDEIRLNASINPQKVCENLSRRAMTKVEPEAVFVYLLFHEIGHFRERKRLNTLGDTKNLQKVREFRSQMEGDAERYAVDCFWNWKLNHWSQVDYKKWKENLKK